MWEDNIHAEIAKGGSGPACPFCKLPRCLRGDYLRCSRCGINWMNGEMLDRDPRRERMDNFLASSAATAPKKKEDRA